jgi:hypothetical protein
LKRGDFIYSNLYECVFKLISYERAGSKITVMDFQNYELRIPKGNYRLATPQEIADEIIVKMTR